MEANMNDMTELAGPGMLPPRRIENLTRIGRFVLNFLCRHEYLSPITVYDESNNKLFR